MVLKLKGEFHPKDYQLYFFRKMQNLKQKRLIVKEYIEEFNKENIRTLYVEDNHEMVARCINGLTFEIEDEMNMFYPIFVEEEY